MDLGEIRLEFEAGRLKEAVIEPAPGRNGWVLRFKDASGSLVSLAAAGEAERVFHSLDAATRLAQEIGFHTVHVEEQF
jgi:hypothetical protein